MQMRNAGTEPQAAPTPVGAYAWRSPPAARKAKCIISRSISRLGIEGSSSARTMRKHRARPASQLSGHEQATAAEFPHPKKDDRFRLHPQPASAQSFDVDPEESPGRQETAATYPKAAGIAIRPPGG